MSVILKYDIQKRNLSSPFLVIFVLGLCWPLLEAIEKLLLLSLSNPGWWGVLEVSLNVSILHGMNLKFPVLSEQYHYYQISTFT